MTTPQHHRAFSVSLALSLLAAVSVPNPLGAQAAEPSAQPPPSTPTTEDELIELSAFEVRADSDRSYGALNSASITRFNVEMDKMPVSADIFTETFMKDVASASVEDVIRDYSAGAGYADGSNNGASTAADNQPGDRTGNAYIQIRGMPTPTMQRDSFMPVGSFSNPGSTGVGRTDNFDIERVEVINGPQALLYGGGGAGGVINVTSKQARFGPKGTGFFNNPKGAVLFRIDDFDSRRGELDFGLGNSWFAARVSLLREKQKTRRDIIGSETEGNYVQLAFRAFQSTVPTTIRFTGSFTENDRWLNRGARLNAPGDARHNMWLSYILFTGREGANDPVTGAPFLRGAILNGKLTWDNMDSLAAGIMHQEPTTNDYSSVTIDTKWSSWLSTQAAAGYNVYTGRRINPGFTFFAPRSGANNTDEWAGALTPQDSWQPSRTKGGRFAALITKDFLNGRAKTQTLFGLDYVWQMHSQIQYRWYQADADWNVIIAPGSTITSPNSGRTVLGQVLWPVSNGPVFDPFPGFNPADDRGVINGVRYVRALENQPQANLRSPSNPHGVPFANGNYIQTKLLNRGFYGVNYTQWFDGRINTLMGLRQGDYVSDRIQNPSGGAVRYLADSSALNFNFGVDWNINRWLHPYINYSDSIQPPYVANRTDPHGAAPQNTEGRGGEIGLKLNNSSGSLSGSVAYFHATAHNDLYSVGGAVRDLISPGGLNGGEGGTNVAIDRVTRGVEMRLTAAPTRNWRMRFSAAWNDGEIGTTKAYDQRYNDQFYANSAGQVTYRNGTVVYVNGNAANATQATVVNASDPGAVPLTINLMSTPGASNFYYANPDPTSGAIDGGTIAARILTGQGNTAGINANGPILTGNVNLPISALQLNTSLAGITTPGTIVATRIGDKTTGYAEYSANFTTNYELSRGWLKGLSIGGSINFTWKNRGYYYYATPLTRANALTLQRTLHYTPDREQVNAFVSYSRKFGRYEWVTQLNVSNVFDDYERRLLPDAATGFNTVTNIRATWYGQPRSWVWTNSLKF